MRPCVHIFRMRSTATMSRPSEHAMEEVASGKADYAVLPIENSTEGIVTDIYDLLTEYQLYIVGEQGVKVEHVLAWNSGYVHG